MLFFNARKFPQTQTARLGPIALMVDAKLSKFHEAAIPVEKNKRISSSGLSRIRTVIFIVPNRFNDHD